MLTTVLTILRRADLSETQNIEPPAERERWPPSEPPAIKAARACVRIPVVFDWWHRPLCRDRPGNANHATLHPVATRCGASQRLVGITRRGGPPPPTNPRRPPGPPGGGLSRGWCEIPGAGGPPLPPTPTRRRCGSLCTYHLSHTRQH